VRVPETGALSLSLRTHQRFNSTLCLCLLEGNTWVNAPHAQQLPGQRVLALPLRGMSSITCKTVKCLGSACFCFREPWTWPTVHVMMSRNAPWQPANRPRPFKSTERQASLHGNTASVSRNLTSHAGPSKLLGVLQLCTLKAVDNDTEDLNCHSACCQSNLKSYE